LVIVRSPVGEVVVASGIVQPSEPGALPGQRRISCGACATASLAIASSRLLMTAQINRTDTIVYRMPFFSIELKNSKIRGHTIGTMLP
jgi:hypothetical protein